jgi:hypothetical protein
MKSAVKVKRQFLISFPRFAVSLGTRLETHYKWLNRSYLHRLTAEN